MPEIDRVVPSTPDQEVLRTIICILGLPRQVSVEALVVVNGQGELTRTTHAVTEWNCGVAAKYLLITGAGIGEQTCRSFNMEDLVQNLGLTRTENVRAQGYPVPSTLEHGQWVVEQLAELGVKRAALYASLYHIPRVYLTVLRYLMDRELDREVLIIPHPVPQSPFDHFPETGQAMFDLIPGEVRRIVTYGNPKRGDIASSQELYAYIRWAWSVI